MNEYHKYIHTLYVQNILRSSEADKEPAFLLEVMRRRDGGVGAASLDVFGHLQNWHVKNIQKHSVGLKACLWVSDPAGSGAVHDHVVSSDFLVVDGMTFDVGAKHEEWYYVYENVCVYPYLCNFKYINDYAHPAWEPIALLFHSRSSASLTKVSCGAFSVSFLSFLLPVAFDAFVAASRSTKHTNTKLNKRSGHNLAFNLRLLFVVWRHLRRKTIQLTRSQPWASHKCCRKTERSVPSTLSLHLPIFDMFCVFWGFYSEKVLSGHHARPCWEYCLYIWLSTCAHCLRLLSWHVVMHPSSEGGNDYETHYIVYCILPNTQCMSYLLTLRWFFWWIKENRPYILWSVMYNIYCCVVNGHNKVIWDPIGAQHCLIRSEHPATMLHNKLKVVSRNRHNMVYRLAFPLASSCWHPMVVSWWNSCEICRWILATPLESVHSWWSHRQWNDRNCGRWEISRT